MSSARKFKSDEILRQLDAAEEEETTESEGVSQDIAFNPSRLRPDAIPTDGAYAGRRVTRAELEASESAASDEEESAWDSDDAPVPENSGDEALEDDLAALEGGGEFDLIESLQQQQEADLRIARGTSALQNQYSALLLMRLKVQGALRLANALPPNAPAGDGSQSTPFAAARENSEVAALLGEAAASAAALQAQLQALKEELRRALDWDESSVAETMMGNISNWSQRLKLGAGMKRGSVINRPVDQQIEAALQEKQFLIQPTRHREHDTQVFGVEEQPDIVDDVYNDADWYNTLLASITGVAAKSSGGKKKVQKLENGKIVTKSKTLKVNQVIEDLQGFMQVQQQPLGTDAFYRSLLK